MVVIRFLVKVMLVFEKFRKGEWLLKWCLIFLLVVFDGIFGGRLVGFFVLKKLVGLGRLVRCIRLEIVFLVFWKLVVRLLCGFLERLDNSVFIWWILVCCLLCILLMKLNRIGL